MKKMRKLCATHGKQKTNFSHFYTEMEKFNNLQKMGKVPQHILHPKKEARSTNIQQTHEKTLSFFIFNC